MPTCGRCKKPNVSAGSIRSCYNGEPNAHEVMSDAEETRLIQARERADDIRAYASKPDMQNEEAMAAVRLAELARTVPKAEGDNSPMWPASEAQKSYLLDLQDQRILPAEYVVHTRNAVDKMERDEVSSLITMLKSFPHKDGKQQVRTDYSMPEGRYALEVNGETWFFQVDKPTKGRWAGYTFIKRLIGSPGSYRKLPMTPPERSKYLSKIDVDPKAAAVLFGQKSKTCFRCHSPLTDPDSLARSMGPICAGKVGW